MASNSNSRLFVGDKFESLVELESAIISFEKSFCVPPQKGRENVGDNEEGCPKEGGGSKVRAIVLWIEIEWSRSVGGASYIQPYSHVKCYSCIINQ